MATHNLKTWPPFFEAVLEGRKTFELRRDDRGVSCRVTYLVRNVPEFGLQPGFVVLGLAEVE